MGRIGEHARLARARAAAAAGGAARAAASDAATADPAVRVERNGRTPDAQLVDGLKLIEQEIGDMTQRLAQADLDSLSTRGRYLEMKYREEKAE